MTNNKNEEKKITDAISSNYSSLHLVMEGRRCCNSTVNDGDFTLFMPFGHHKVRNQALAHGCLFRHLLGEGILMSFRAWASQIIFYIQSTKFIFRPL